MATSTQRAAHDLWAGFKSPRIWLLLAWYDLEARYRRTILGPLWHTLTMAGWIVGLAVIFSTVRYRDDDGFLLYLSAGVTGWTLLAGMLGEGSSAFQRGGNLLATYDLPASVHIFRSVMNQLIMFAHTLVVMAGILIYTGTGLTLHSLMIIPAVGLYFVFGVGATMCLALLGARFRDVSPALGAALAFMFLVTPVFWRKESLGDRMWIADYNPLYHLLEVIRAPLMGQPAAPVSWGVAVVLAIGLTAVGTLAFMRFRRVLNYWI